jgi:AraC-like DNA-binding protein
MKKADCSPAVAAVATIRASVVSLILDGLASRNLPTDGLLGKGNEPLRLTDPYAELDLRRYVAFFEAAAALAHDPFFGLRLAQEIEIEQFGPLAIVILAAGNLGKAMRAWARYSSTVQSGTLTEAVTCGDMTECVYQICDSSIRPRRQDTEFTLGLVCRLFHGAVGRQWAPLAVEFEHGAPESFGTLAARRLYHRAFGCPVEFGASSNRVLVPSADLDLPTAGAYHGLAPFVEHLLRTLERPEAAERLSERVIRMVGSRLGHRRITVMAVADVMGLSARTLQRRLEAEGTSLRAIVRECRRSRAEAMLADPRRQVTTIAHSLGYADTAVLSRAFRLWTGAAPRTYRRRREDRG